MSATRCASGLLFLAAGLLLSADAQAMMCEPDSLETQVTDADAIATGTVTAVKYVPNNLLDFLCWESEPDGHEHCGAKIATLRLSRIWKGDLPPEINVYSEDACYCTGEYFFENGEMLLILSRYRGVASPTIRVDYRTYACGKSMPLQDAEGNGILEFLDRSSPVP